MNEQNYYETKPRKKRLWPKILIGIVIIFVLLIGALVFFGERLIMSPQVRALIDKALTMDIPKEEGPYIDFLQKQLREVEGYTQRTSISSYDDMQDCVMQFNSWALIVEQGYKFNLTGSNRALLQKFESKVKGVQKEVFPKLRQIFAGFIEQQFAQEGMSVKVSIGGENRKTAIVKTGFEDEAWDDDDMDDPFINFVVNLTRLDAMEIYDANGQLLGRLKGAGLTDDMLAVLSFTDLKFRAVNTGR